MISFIILNGVNDYSRGEDVRPSWFHQKANLAEAISNAKTSFIEMHNYK
jgi:hypothetical protein